MFATLIGASSIDDDKIGCRLLQLPLMTSTRYKVESACGFGAAASRESDYRALGVLQNLNNRTKDRHSSVAAGTSPKDL